MLIRAKIPAPATGIKFTASVISFNTDNNPDTKSIPVFNVSESKKLYQNLSAWFSIFFSLPETESNFLSSSSWALPSLFLEDSYTLSKSCGFSKIDAAMLERFFSYV